MDFRLEPAGSKIRQNGGPFCGPQIEACQDRRIDLEHDQERNDVPDIDLPVVHFSLSPCLGLQLGTNGKMDSGGLAPPASPILAFRKSENKTCLLIFALRAKMVSIKKPKTRKGFPTTGFDQTPYGSNASMGAKNPGSLPFPKVCCERSALFCRTPVPYTGTVARLLSYEPIEAAGAAGKVNARKP